jgi:hypothetical protein
VPLGSSGPGHASTAVVVALPVGSGTVLPMKDLQSRERLHDCRCMGQARDVKEENVPMQTKRMPRIILSQTRDFSEPLTHALAIIVV